MLVDVCVKPLGLVWVSFSDGGHLPGKMPKYGRRRGTRQCLAECGDGFGFDHVRTAWHSFLSMRLIAEEGSIRRLAYFSSARSDAMENTVVSGCIGRQKDS